MKNNKGITLVALVITIIVLIILAAVSLAALSGDNSIIGRGQEARDNTALAEAKETINVALSTVKTEATALLAVENTDPTATYLPGLDSDASSLGIDSSYDVVYDTTTKVLTISTNVTTGTTKYSVSGKIDFNTEVPEGSPEGTVASGSKTGVITQATQTVKE